MQRETIDARLLREAEERDRERVNDLYLALRDAHAAGLRPGDIDYDLAVDAYREASDDYIKSYPILRKR